MQNRYLEKTEYARIRCKAKRLGCESLQFKFIQHDVHFKHTTVSFAFYPFEYHINIRCKDFFKGYFSTREEAESIKRDMDIALDFVEFLKEFDAQLPKKEMEYYTSLL